MPFARRIATTLAVAVILCASRAHAEPGDTSNEARDAARRAFEQGEQAFEARDYLLAAKAFEDAFRIAPHYASLWNAARSWDRAGEQARAANAYAKYLHLAPADAPDRDAATAALAALAERLGRIEVHAPGIDAVRINDELLEGNSIYVNPGNHVIAGQTKAGIVQRTEILEAGTVRSVALVEEIKRVEMDAPASVSPPAPPIRLSRPNVVAPLRPSSNTAPAWFGPAAIVTGGVTVASAALVVWSGMDTLSARKKFDAAPTSDKLEAGQDKQLRTNLLIGTMVSSGIATGVLLSLWKWNGSTVQSAVTVLPPAWGLPAQMVLTGSF